MENFIFCVVNTFEDFLTITFHGDVCHQPGDFQSRGIIDEERRIYIYNISKESKSQTKQCL